MNNQQMIGKLVLLRDNLLGSSYFFRANKTTDSMSDHNLLNFWIALLQANEMHNVFKVHVMTECNVVWRTIMDDTQDNE